MIEMFFLCTYSYQFQFETVLIHISLNKMPKLDESAKLLKADLDMRYLASLKQRTFVIHQICILREWSNIFTKPQ